MPTTEIIEWLYFLEKGFWFACAAVGFGVLFNVPNRTLWVTGLLSAFGGLTKLLLIKIGANLVLSTLGGATLIGLLSIWAAHYKHSPHLVFSIPAVIPMIPGLLAYRMMLGLVKLVSHPVGDEFTKILADTIYNGINVLFISMSLAIGVAIPMLMTRKNSIKHVKFKYG